MKKGLILVLLMGALGAVKAQQVDSIFFNLYTDSLKKGFYNYINVDGKMSDGSWQPLDSSQIRLLSDGGIFRGNDLFIDSSWQAPFVRVKAILRSNPRIHRDVIIYIRKRGFDEPLKSNDEILYNLQPKKKKG